MFVPCSDGLLALAVTSDSITIQWSVGHPQLASPIVATGAVWAIDSSSGLLYALNPTDGKVLVTTGLGSPAAHFATPAATDGFVVAAAGQKVVGISVSS